MNHLEIEGTFLKNKLGQISSNASSKHELKEILKSVGQKQNKGKIGTFDLLEVEKKVRYFE